LDESGGRLGREGALKDTQPTEISEYNAPPSQRDTAWAMSEENVDLTYRAFDAANRRGLDGFLALMAEPTG
jgi:hypothetical protein